MTSRRSRCVDRRRQMAHGERNAEFDLHLLHLVDRIKHDLSYRGLSSGDPRATDWATSPSSNRGTEKRYSVKIP